MKITFLGAAREVTGSCYLIEVGNKHIMIDCGMEQGPDLYENQTLNIAPASVDAVLLTHAHIDHSGKLPLLYKNGYRGRIYMTRASRDLCKIMLMDSAHIQEQEAEWRNKKAKRSSGNPPYTPLYDSADAENTLKLIRAEDYDVVFDVAEGVKARFIDAGHLLGSAYIELTLTENGVERTVIFSGDIGNVNKPIIRNPSVVTKADYVIMESTYGDRSHGDDPDYAADLSKIITDTFTRGGNVVIPTFAVGRMQEMLYFLREIKNKNLVPKFPDFQVFVDSPLAIEATGIYSKNVASLCDDETAGLIERGINPIGFRDMVLSVTAEDSKKINADSRPKVILSASGMCEAGRIRHHLKHNLWRRESTIVFVGYQVAGTLGRALLDGAKAVKLFGEPSRYQLPRRPRSSVAMGEKFRACPQKNFRHSRRGQSRGRLCRFAVPNSRSSRRSALSRRMLRPDHGRMFGQGKHRSQKATQTASEKHFRGISSRSGRGERVATGGSFRRRVIQPRPKGHSRRHKGSVEKILITKK